MGVHFFWVPHFSNLDFFLPKVAQTPIKILLSDLTIFGAENRAEMTILGADFME